MPILEATFAVAVTVQAAAVTDMLAAYDEERYEYVASRLPSHFSTPADAERFLRDLRALKRQASSMAFAGFVVESAAHAAKINPSAAKEIVELGCERLRASTVPEAYLRRWNVAAIAAVSGPADDSYRARWGQVVSVFGSGWLDIHLAHMPKSVRDSPDVVFAWAVNRQAVVHTLDLTWNRNGPRVGDGAQITQALAALNRTLAEPSLEAESSLRIGWFEARSGQRERAAERWRRLDNDSVPPVVRYTALLLLGRQLLEAGRAAEAKEPLARALQLRPDAGHSAWLGLRVARSLSGRAAAHLDVPVPFQREHDPWLRFYESYGGLGVERQSVIHGVRNRFHV